MTQLPASVSTAVLVLAGVLMLPAPRCEAQALPSGTTAVGAPRVRITWRAGEGPRRDVGEVTYRDSGTVVLWASSTRQYSIVADSIRRVEFGWQRPHPTRRGAAIGALAGAAFGAFWVLVNHDQCEADPNCLNLSSERGSNALLAGAVFGVLGGGVGALIGRARRDVWRDTVLMVGGRPVPVQRAR